MKDVVIVSAVRSHISSYLGAFCETMACDPWAPALNEAVS